MFQLALKGMDYINVRDCYVNITGKLHKLQVPLKAPMNAFCCNVFGA